MKGKSHSNMNFNSTTLGWEIWRSQTGWEVWRNQTDWGEKGRRGSTIKLPWVSLNNICSSDTYTKYQLCLFHCLFFNCGAKACLLAESKSSRPEYLSKYPFYWSRCCWNRMSRLQAYLTLNCLIMPDSCWPFTYAHT